jgi:photosystem II stability/assembly factor-like uncharacterized protein
MHFRCILLYFGVVLLYSASTIGGDAGLPAPRFERIGPFGGDVRSLLLDSQLPDVAYLGTSDGRLFKSSDGGNSWKVLVPGIGPYEYVMDTLVQHPVEAERIYAGAWDLHSDGGGLFESRDGGLKWVRIVLPEASVAVRGFAICKSNPDRMIVGTLAGAYVSADGGRVWKQVGGTRLQKAESVAIDPVDPRILYVGTWRLGYKSVDFGKTWTLVNRGMPLDSDVFSISIHANNPEIVYASACSGVFRSTNRAQSWARLKILHDRFTIRAQVVFLDPVDPRRVYSGTTEGLFVSQNEGRTWTRLTSGNVTVNAIQVDPRNNRRILIGTEYQGLQVSEDGGRLWRGSNTGFVHKRVSWIVPDSPGSDRFLVGVLSGGGGLYRYDSRNQTWQLSQIGPGLRILCYLVLPEDQGHLAGTSQGLYWLPSGSDRWKKLGGSIAKRTVHSLVLDPASPVIYAGTDQGIYRTSVAAMDFRLPPGYRLSPSAWCIYAPETAPGLVYAGTSLGLIRSWDKGTTWNVISAYGLPARAAIESIAVSPSNKDHLLVGTSAGLFESKNGGIHWRQAGDGRLGVAISSVSFPDKSGDTILAADKTSGGLFYSKTGGLVWEKISDPSYPSPIYCLGSDPQRPSVVYLGTRSEGVYRLHLP